MANTKDTKKGGPVADQDRIEALVAKLHSDDGLERQQARQSLVDIGEPAIDPLTKLLGSDEEFVPWEAAKALSQIRTPQAAEILVDTLTHDEANVRWLAAEGLISLERNGLEPLLQALISHSDSVRLRENAHHVIQDLVNQRRVSGELREQLESVLAALQGVEPVVETPLAAEKALRVLRR
jgi:HEAT repeat protein